MSFLYLQSPNLIGGQSSGSPRKHSVQHSVVFQSPEQNGKEGKVDLEGKMEGDGEHYQVHSILPGAESNYNYCNTKEYTDQVSDFSSIFGG